MVRAGGLGRRCEVSPQDLDLELVDRLLRRRGALVEQRLDGAVRLAGRPLAASGHRPADEPVEVGLRLEGMVDAVAVGDVLDPDRDVLVEVGKLAGVHAARLAEMAPHRLGVAVDGERDADGAVGPVAQPHLDRLDRRQHRQDADHGERDHERPLRAREVEIAGVGIADGRQHVVHPVENDPAVEGQRRVDAEEHRGVEQVGLKDQPRVAQVGGGEPIEQLALGGHRVRGVARAPVEAGDGEEGDEGGARQERQEEGVAEVYAVERREGLGLRQGEALAAVGGRHAARPYIERVRHPGDYRSLPAGRSRRTRGFSTC